MRGRGGMVNRQFHPSAAARWGSGARGGGEAGRALRQRARRHGVGIFSRSPAVGKSGRSPFICASSWVAVWSCSRAWWSCADTGVSAGRPSMGTRLAQPRATI